MPPPLHLRATLLPDGARRDVFVVHGRTPTCRARSPRDACSPARALLPGSRPRGRTRRPPGRRRGGGPAQWRVAKVIADFLAPGGRITPAFPAEALVEAARRVHAVGARIAAHATHPDVIDVCLAAGFDSLEHASLMRLDQIDALVASGTAIVPTLLIREPVLGAVRGFGGDDASVTAMADALDSQRDVVRTAAARG